MKILLDTHGVLWLLRNSLGEKWQAMHSRLASGEDLFFASVASLWEMSIKTRLGKLDCGMPVSDAATFLERTGFTILPIVTSHAVYEIQPSPFTRDPFDRLLLAQCAVEGMRLATLDRALAGHPLSLSV